MPHQQLTTGISMYLEDVGIGPPIVFVHGWSMSGRFFAQQIMALSLSYRVIVPDLRGCGQSEKVLYGHTMATYARDLGALLAARQVNRPVLVGWSMGAMVAYEYIKQVGQEAVAGLVIVDQPPSAFAWEGYEFGGFTLPELAAFVNDLQTDQRAMAQSFADEMLHAPTPSAREWMAAEIMRVPAAIATAMVVTSALRDDRDFLPTLRMPTLLLFGGDEEKGSCPAAGAFMAQQIPGAQLHIFEKSGHCPFYEEPDLFNEIVGHFAAGVARSA
jgi:pimeloyl-ACP methyl ester carboxylesterase